MSEKLEQCPFCGSNDLGIDGKSSITWFAVTCHACGASMCNQERAGAIRDWNRRAPGPATAKMVFKLAWFMEHFGRDGDMEVPIKREMAAAFLAEQGAAKEGGGGQ